MPTRKDITEGKAGIPFQLYVTILDSATCKPITEGLVLEIWHCDALGVYSHYEAQSLGTGTQTDDTTYMRGLQAANSSGVAEFKTIYPGWYVGRDVHIHYKVHINGKTVLTSQFFIDDAISDQIALLEPYVQHKITRTRLTEDGIYTSTAGLLDLAVNGTKLSDGFIATTTIAVDTTATSSNGNGGGPGGRPTMGGYTTREKWLIAAVVILSVILVAAAIAAGFYFYKKKHAPTHQERIAEIQQIEEEIV
jgi:protocatechuate 3,4-dioxygenase beta subunit